MSLDNLKRRLNYYGDSIQHRFESDKVRALRQALKLSYQAETIALNDGREFLALINPDKLKIDTDDKVLSIPFNDICLNKPRIGKTTEGFEEVGIKAGDTFQWKETDTQWIVFERRLQELAYFKAEIRRCRHTITINDQEQHIYIKQPAVQSMIWTTKQDRFSWNDMNYKLQLYITKDENTSNQFHRFTQIRIDGDVWETVSCDEISAEGLIIVYLREYFNNTLKDEIDAETAEKLANAKTDKDKDSPKIAGEDKVYPYDIKHYHILNMVADGTWTLDKPKSARFLKMNESEAVVEFITGKSDEVTLTYTRAEMTEEDSVILKIKVQSI